MSKPKVLMLGWEYPPKMEGGLGTHFYNLTCNLARQGVRVSAVLPGFCRAKNRKNLSFTLVPIGKNNGSYPELLHTVRQCNKRMLRAAPEIMRKKGISIIHAHDWITAEAAITLRETTGAKLVMTFHSTEYDRNEHADGKSGMARLERMAAKKADLIIAVSGIVKRTLVEKYHADKKKIFVVPNGPSIAKFPKAKENNTVLFAGRLASQKGAEHLISAMPKVRQNCKFIICGQGHLRKPLEGYADALGVSGRVAFRGFLPQKELARLYSECSLFVSPSLREPFGISLLDAMAAGKPCIVTRKTGLLEFIPKGACIVVREKRPEELARAISLLLKDGKKRAELGKKAKAASRKFSWTRTAAQTIELYRRLDHNVL